MKLDNARNKIIVGFIVLVILFGVSIALLRLVDGLHTSRVADGSLIDVIVNRYDLSRTGANLKEVLLNTSNVNAEQFGKLFSVPVEGDIYTQPLIVNGLNIPNRGRHN